jgi:hypothetical protein
VLVGALSIVGGLFHLLYLKDVPIAHWIMGLPGVLMGSIFGPFLNAMLGPKRVMIAFILVLVAEVIRNTVELMRS